MTFVLLGAGFWNYVFGISMFLLSLFLIMLVLVQRGRGGGLTGALGGMGGQSAFGAKAGDVFTRITMVAATLWILLCIAAIMVLGTEDKFGGSSAARTGTVPRGTSGQQLPAEQSGATETPSSDEPSGRDTSGGGAEDAVTGGEPEASSTAPASTNDSATEAAGDSSGAGQAPAPGDASGGGNP